MTLHLVQNLDHQLEIQDNLREAPSEPRPFPIQTLEKALRWPSIGRLGILLAVNPRQVYRWRQSGLTARQADALAIRCRMHPCEVWGAAWWKAGRR